MGFTYLVFKTTYIDRRIPLREGTFFFARRTLVVPLLITEKQWNVSRKRPIRELKFLKIVYLCEPLSSRMHSGMGGKSAQ